MKIERNKFDKTICKITFEIPQVGFEIELRGYITILDGESNTGKSFLLKSLYLTYVDNPKSFEKYKINSVFFFNYQSSIEDLIFTIKNKKGCLILIDNANCIFLGNKGKEAVNYINYDIYNQYLIVNRTGWTFNVTPNHYAKLKREGNKIVTTFDWSVSGWN